MMVPNVSEDTIRSVRSEATSGLMVRNESDRIIKPAFIPAENSLMPLALPSS